jgi:ankyrin repeat protein
MALTRKTAPKKGKRHTAVKLRGGNLPAMNPIEGEPGTNLNAKIEGESARNQNKKEPVRNNYGAMNNFYNGPSESLIEAVERKNLAEVKKFLEDPSTDVNQKDDRGMTALHYAVENNDKPIVNALLAYRGGDNNKLDIEALDNYDRSPLFLAYLSYDADRNINHIIGILLDNGANINAQDKNGKTILMKLLSRTNPNMTMIKSAMEGANINLKDKKGKTAIDYAKNQLARATGSQRNDMKNLVDSMERNAKNQLARLTKLQQDAMKNLVNSMERNATPKAEGQAGGRRKKRTKTRRLKK